MDEARHRRWRPLPVSRVASLLAGARFPWWFCGGHAIDLFLGRETRDHADVDVGVLRGDQPALFTRLEAFEVWLAKDGSLRELDGEERAAGLGADARGFWCRPRGETDWALQVLSNEGDRETWVFRRDPRITRPFPETVQHGPAGLPYLAPELQLLFKAKAPREKDECDFEATLPALGREARAWLHEALDRVHPGHPWIALCDRPAETGVAE